MWWPDRTGASSKPGLAALGRGGAVLLVALAAGSLAGCSNVRPLYGSVEGGGPSTAVKLTHVDLKLADSRVSQRVRNDLYFAFYGGGDPGEPHYRLNLRVTDSSLPVGIERMATIPAAYLVQLNCAFTLVEVTTGRTLMTGTSFANASYDFSQQRFANVRAQRDAENRAATQIANDVRTKVAAFLATSS